MKYEAIFDWQYCGSSFCFDSGEEMDWFLETIEKYYKHNEGKDPLEGIRIHMLEKEVIDEVQDA